MMTIQGMVRIVSGLLGSTLLAAAGPGDRVSVEFTKALEESGAPGMAGAVFDTETILGRADLGVRMAGKGRKIEEGDLWHIGSDGKAITATLVACLVEAEELTWETTMKEVFGSAAKRFHPQAQEITVRQLLSHTAGLAPNVPDELFRAGQQAGSRSIRKQRMKVVEEVLGQAPLSKPGTKYLYSNTGYVVAGAVVEEVLGTTWEKAIEKEVFSPLGMKTVSFGAPTGSSQPRGHRVGPDGEREAAPEGAAGDNPAIYGPAGGMHLSVADWVLFLQEHLKGHQGKGKLLKQETYRELHRPVSDDYAMGWGVGKDGKTLSHDGSNTYWYATVKLDLDAGVGVIGLANDAGPNTAGALHRAASESLSKE